LDQALGESGDACVVVLGCTYVSYGSRIRAICERRREDASVPLHANSLQSQMRRPARGMPQAPYSWTGRNKHSPRASLHLCVVLPPNLNMCTTHFHFLLGNPTRLTHPNHERTGQRPAPQPPLLPAATDNRLKPHPGPAPYIRRTDALGSINLVPADAHQVDVHLLHVEWDLTHGLRCVGVEVDTAVLPHERADLLEGLDDARLVVHGHDGHQDCLLWPDGGVEGRERDEAVPLHGEVGDFEAFFGELAAGVEDAFVFLQRQVG
jgi:hypothetical protein